MSERCTQDPVRVLGREPLFSSLAEEELSRLARRSLCRSVSRGSSLLDARCGVADRAVREGPSTGDETMREIDVAAVLAVPR